MASIFLSIRREMRSWRRHDVAGVMLGLLTPAAAWMSDCSFRDIVGDVHERLREDRDGQVEHRHGSPLGQLQTATREAVSPLERLETGLHPWVAFGIMPIFALANAGVPIEPAAFTHPVSLAVALGLVVGKPVGIVLTCWLAVRTGVARLPTGVNWSILLGGGCLAGIGFTMSLFIAGLALDGELLQAGKIGTLTGSAVSVFVGSLVLLTVLPRRERPDDGSDRFLAAAKT